MKISFKKKLLSIVLSVILIFAVIPFGAFSVSAETYSGWCGNNLTWNYNTSTYTLTMSGTGDMYDYSSSYNSIAETYITIALWGNYYNSMKTLVINNGVTSIGGSAFSGCIGLTSITIPDSVTSIGSSAFYNCTGLTSVTIPNSVTQISDCAFYKCTALTSIAIPNSVTSIGYYAFNECTNLNYNIYDNGKYLGNSENPYLVLVKASSTYITSCNINQNTKFIHSEAFYRCTGLTSITIPDSVTSIGDGNAFFCCTGLTSVTIGNSVTSIGDSAFRGCTGLTSITIPNSVTSIGMVRSVVALDLQKLIFPIYLLGAK